MALSPTSAHASGGSQPITRGHYGYSPQTILASDSGNLKFGALQAGGSALLDRSVVTKPTIVTAGTYALAAQIGLDDNLSAGEYFSADLLADVDGGDNATDVTGQFVATANLLEPTLLLTLTWYLPAGAAIQISVGNNSSNPHDYWVSPFYIQRLS